MNDEIQKYLNHGFNVIPVNQDKTPACDWKHFKNNKIENLKLFTTDCIGIVCGKISDSLEVLDFDNHNGTAKENLSNFLNHDLIKPIYEKYKLPVVKTQSGGFHIYYRCDKIEGNQKLAMVKLNGKPDAIIETRGEGGYILAPPSKGYEFIRNSFEDLQFITEQERQLIIEFAKTFNKHEKSIKKYKANTDNDKPGNIYDNTPEAIEEAKSALKSIGWEDLGFNNCWRRPGKNKGISATFGNIAPNVFYSFSSNVEYFDFETAYTPFSIVSLIKYNGDFSKFASELAKRYKLNGKAKEPEPSKEDLKAELLKYYNDPDINIEKPPMVIGIRTQNNIAPIMTLGNLSVLKGAAKSKKTYLMSMFAASAIANSELFRDIITDIPKNKRQVVIFDTEQSKFHSARLSNRIIKMSYSNAEHFGSFNFRGLEAEKIIQLINYACDLYSQLGVLFIDQVADLMKSVNEEKEAIQVVRFLEHLSDKKQIHICVVIHQNKLNNFAQGWLGTQLMKKAETIIEVEKDHEFANMSTVKANLTRDIGFEDFKFLINDNGYPEVAKTF
jgi:hypothetical protein